MSQSQHHFTDDPEGTLDSNNQHQHLKREDELTSDVGAQMSTHLLYQPNMSMNMNLLGTMTEGDFSHVNPESPQQEQKPLLPESSSSPVEIDGVHYNSRGYEICGQLNQHSKPCQRIGSCPFHKKGGDVPEENGGAEKQVPQITETKPKKQKEKKILSKDPPIKRAPYKRGWTKEEHILFLNGLQIHGKGAWKEISMIVQTRTPTQIQSHAQKYFLRQKQEVKNKRSIHDISLDDLNDMAPEPVRSLNQHKPIHMTRGPPNFGYPMIAQFPQEHLNMILNPLQMLPNAMSPSFQLPYGTNGWLPQIYPFTMPMAMSPNMHEDHRSLGIDLDERDPSDQVMPMKQNPEEYSPRITGEKRTFDSYSFHTYPTMEDKSPSKVLKTNTNDEGFLFP